jgi:quinol monooxygenase YgiN
MKKKVIARLFIKNESIESFKKQTVEIIQKTRKEKGCIFYSLFQDVSSPGEFLFYEEYASQDALDIHSNSEYLKTFRTSVSKMQSKEKVVDIV